MINDLKYACKKTNITVPFEQPDYVNISLISNAECFQGNQSLVVKTIVRDYINSDKIINIPSYGDVKCSELIEKGNRRLTLSKIKYICENTLRKNFLDNLNNLPLPLKMDVHNFIIMFVKYLYKKHEYNKKLNIESQKAIIGSLNNVSFYDNNGFHCLYICVDKVISRESEEFLGVSHKSRFVGGKYGDTDDVINEIISVLKNNGQNIIKIEERNGYYINAAGFKILADYYENETDIIQNKLNV